MTVLQPVAHRPKIDHAQAAGVWKTVAANIFITIGAFKYPILTIIAGPIVADFQYVVYTYFTQIINVTDILLQLFWGRILYSLDYNTQHVEGVLLIIRRSTIHRKHGPRLAARRHGT